MGIGITVACLGCQEVFMAKSGGGFFFYLLHCDTCGSERELPNTELYEEGSVFLSLLEAEKDDIQTLPDSRINQLMEKTVDPCQCGGTFTFDAPARCPKCKSKRYTQLDEPPLFYD